MAACVRAHTRTCTRARFPAISLLQRQRPLAITRCHEYNTYWSIVTGNPDQTFNVVRIVFPGECSMYIASSPNLASIMTRTRADARRCAFLSGVQWKCIAIRRSAVRRWRRLSAAAISAVGIPPDKLSPRGVPCGRAHLIATTSPDLGHPSAEYGSALARLTQFRYRPILRLATAFRVF